MITGHFNHCHQVNFLSLSSVFCCRAGSGYPNRYPVLGNSRGGFPLPSSWFVITYCDQSFPSPWYCLSAAPSLSSATLSSTLEGVTYQYHFSQSQQTYLFLKTAQESRGSRRPTPAFLYCSDPPCLGVLCPSLALCHHPHTGSELRVHTKTCHPYYCRIAYTVTLS